MQDILTNLSTYGYIILFLYSLGGGMVAIIGAGLLSFEGNMNLTLSIIIAAIANFIGDMILVYMGRYNKSSVMPYFKSHKRKLALAQILFKKYVYGLKTLIPLAIGLTKYSLIKFAIINAICSAIWAISLGLVSYYAGGFISQFASYFGDRAYIVPIFLFALLGSIWIYFSWATKRR